MLVDRAKTVDESSLRVVSLCYKYCFLQGRQGTGQALPTPSLRRLKSLQHLLEGDSMGPGQRRRHRRLPVMLPTLLKTPGGLRPGTLINLSGGGMFVLCSESLPIGATVHVRLSRPGMVDYCFPCTVTRRAGGGMGLAFSGIPLEVRRGVAA